MNEENGRRVNVRMARRQQQKKAMRRRLLKIGSVAAVFLVLVGAIAGLYFHGKKDFNTKNTTIKTSETASKSAFSTAKTSKTEEIRHATQASDEDTLTDQLQNILTTYTKKIEEQTPRLIEEYQAEIQNNQNGVAGLSTIANQKARDLQVISDEGIDQLKAKYQAAQTKENVDLGAWIDQLSAKYTEQVAKISDIYLRTSASLQAENSSNPQTSETTASLSQTTSSSTTEAPYFNQEMQNQTSTVSSSEQNRSETTVVRPGEGPNQIAERTGVPVEKILALNGMTMEDYFFNPGEVLKLN
ncbi:LysM peptidoglycan-binding domain-containing protein [Enterococcus ratti]|nr:LysM peptidoglycan-binding domain-containing protein [Enterococcus ratti]